MSYLPDSKIKFLALAFLVLTVAGLGFFAVDTYAPQPALTTFLLPKLPELELELNQNQIADLVKPSVVRIVQYATGTAIVPPFKVDLKNYAITFPKGKSVNVPIDLKLTGTGFFVRPDGYIVTNSHVVSPQMIKYTAVLPLIFQAFFKETLTALSKNSKAQFDDEKMTEFGKTIFEQLAEKSTFQFDQKISVVNPSLGNEKFDDALESGFPVTVIKSGDFISDEKDLAVIKISQTNTPALALGDSEGLTTGNRIFVFGFPGTAQISFKDLIEPTFTQGIINAFKDSEKKDFKYIQTDAKVASGSSGGPLLDEKGNTVGIITLQSQAGALSGGGDVFAFAIPLDPVNDFLKNSRTNPEPGAYYKHLLAGLQLLRNNHCEKAIKEFDQAQETNKAFAIRLDAYIDQCKGIIAKRESIDNWKNELAARLRLVPAFTWVLAGGSLVIIVFLGIFTFVLRKRMKVEEKELHILEERVAKDEAVTRNPGADISAYVMQARKSGMSDEAIRNALRTSGWADPDIEKALMNK
ncbi:hypothetical protein A2W57_02090 [Candidatus Giovannonibacteria bacterium RIFCSPHIGHO2_02_43_16]|uniref:Uncharacterized protein n=1 Tax=Candidatus Giovannonibacteria bacterium RIFCSPHIGHO2_02_43_16 TaxID=1798331 RepID=A0A1F5WE55_9BACT|nr:MAG: hypothetical protein A2W57_02090 [Candidatus Giovannonibacteria bacterium RIFCSPHIGHO2_02_43_16]